MIRHGVRRRYVQVSGGLALVPEDPPLLPGDLEIDLSGLEHDDEPSVCRVRTNPIDQSALEALIALTRKP